MTITGSVSRVPVPPPFPVGEDPWVAIVNQRKLNDGTKELILNAIYRQPRTITQLAELLGISVPAVHRHVVGPARGRA